MPKNPWNNFLFDHYDGFESFLIILVLILSYLPLLQVRTTAGFQHSAVVSQQWSYRQLSFFNFNVSMTSKGFFQHIRFMHGLTQWHNLNMEFTEPRCHTYLYILYIPWCCMCCYFSDLLQSRGAVMHDYSCDRATCSRSWNNRYTL